MSEAVKEALLQRCGVAEQDIHLPTVVHRWAYTVKALVCMALRRRRSYLWTPLAPPDHPNARSTGRHWTWDGTWVTVAEWNFHSGWGPDGTWWDWESLYVRHGWRQWWYTHEYDSN